MAKKRMFSLDIVDTDVFLDMPSSARLLYYDLCMRADDEGFISKTKVIMRMTGASNDDLKVLITKNFIIPFNDGVCVVKHWLIHNYIRKDRFQPTNYLSERKKLFIKANSAYTLDATKAIDGTNEFDYVSQEPDWLTARKEAYKCGALPSSFDYKIKPYFIGKVCPVCGIIMQPSEYGNKTMPSIQHCTPISEGGKHDIDNIAIICNGCNIKLRNTKTDKLNNKEVSEVWGTISADGMPTVDTDKSSIEKNSIVESSNKPTKHKHGEYQHVLLTDEELEKLKVRFSDWQAKIQNLDTGIELKGYKYKNHYLAILKWSEKDNPSTSRTKNLSLKYAKYSDIPEVERQGITLEQWNDYRKG